MARKGFRNILEDALRFKIIPNSNKYKGVPISDAKDDIANKQVHSADSSSLIDIEALNSFRTLSKLRQDKYADYEQMASDATIAAALEMYADDATQYNFRTGKVIWVESDDPTIADAGNRLIDVLSLNEKAWRHIYSLCTYGDLYLRIYRDGDEPDYNDILDSNSTSSNSTIIKAKVEDESRRMEEYLEYVDDPATIYDLQLKDKTCGFVRLKSSDSKATPSIIHGVSTNTVDINNVNIYDRTSFVHISLSESIDRNPEYLALSDGNEATVYKVKTGKSILADAYEPSQTVKLLEDSLMMNRLTRSALVRILQIEMGDMPKPEVESLLRRIKNMIEQKIALNANSGEVRSYNSPAPIENVIYVPTKDGKGTITSTNLGGDINVKDIVDVDYFNNKKLSALKIPKQYLNYDAPEGLGNGTSLTKLSSRYAHTIMRIQNAYKSGVTTILNLFFMDKKLDYVNKFTVKMVSPSTIEDAERDDQMSTRIDQSRSILELVENKLSEDGMQKVLEWLFSEFLSISDISDIINKYKVHMQGDGFEDGGFDSPIGGGRLSSGMPDDFGGGGFDEMPMSDEMGGETETTPETTEPEE